MLLALVVLAVLAGVGWWAYEAYYARQPTGVLQGPPNPDTALAVTATPVELGPTSGVVAELPRGRGRVQGATRRGHVRRGFEKRVDVRGSMAWMRGARSLPFDTDAGLMVTVTASVERGRFRVYLRDPDAEGYRWAEARPGEPLRVSGYLMSGLKSYFFYVEAVGGRAEGVRWTVEGTG